MILDKSNYKQVSIVYRNMLNQFETFGYTLEDLMKDNIFIFVKYDEKGENIIYQSIREIYKEKWGGLNWVHFSYSLLDYPYRKEGIGIEMFQESIDFFKDLLDEDYLLTVSSRVSNRRSINLFKKCNLKRYSHHFSIINKCIILFFSYYKVIENENSKNK